MAQKKINNKKSGSQNGKAVVASSNDNLLWMSGFVLLAVGLFATVSVLSHFLNWSSDVSAIQNDESVAGVVIP